MIGFSKMNAPHTPHYIAVDRRAFFQQSGVRLGAMALASLLSQSSRAIGASEGANPLAPKPPHYPPRAKNVIYLHMIGAPSQLDLFDSKPALNKFDGQPCPAELTKGKRFAFLGDDLTLA